MAELQPIHNEQERLRQAIPEDMQAVDSWVYWKLISVHDRTVKMPFSPLTGEAAKTTEPSTWGTFEDALTAYSYAHANGVGFVFSEHDPFTGVDFDHCIQDGVLDEDVKKIVCSLNSYTEISQSGEGLHVIVEGHIPTGRRTIGIELYSEARYFALTGKHLVGTPQAVLKAQEALDALYHSFDPKPARNALEMSHATFYNVCPDDRVLEKAMKAKNGASFSRLFSGNWAGLPSKSDGDWALLLKLGYWTNYDPTQMERLFMQSGLVDEKTLSMRGEVTYLQWNINKIVAQHMPKK